MAAVIFETLGKDNCNLNPRKACAPGNAMRHSSSTFFIRSERSGFSWSFCSCSASSFATFWLRIPAFGLPATSHTISRRQKFPPPLPSLARKED